MIHEKTWSLHSLVSKFWVKATFECHLELSEKPHEGNDESRNNGSLAIGASQLLQRHRIHLSLTETMVTQQLRQHDGIIETII